MDDRRAIEAASRPSGRRKPLDALMAQISDPTFTVRHRRLPTTREQTGHVSPSILAVSSPRSKYARQWRRHAQRCQSCASVFRYLGLPVD